MSHRHHCHFHSTQLITKFCTAVSCTLPLCVECEPIHLQEHHGQLAEHPLITFQQAYNQAIAQIQSHLQQQSSALKFYHKALQLDREAVLQLIEQYYTNQLKSYEAARQKQQTLEDKLHKLKKGSIKTLIFFYSGDIALQKDNLELKPLLDNVKNQLQRMEQHQKGQESSTLKKEYEVNEVQQTSKNKPSSAQRVLNSISQQQPNIFHSIDEVKLSEKHRDKTRKSIFEPPKKNSLQDQPRERNNKYNYNLNPTIENHEETTSRANKHQRMNSAEFKDQYSKDKSRERQRNRERQRQQDRERQREEKSREKQRQREKERQRERERQREKERQRERQREKSRQRERQLLKKQEPQPPVSFQHRYTNKFTAGQQYEAYKRERQEKQFKPYTQQHKISQPQTTRPFQNKENFTHKVLTPSDLDFPTKNNHTFNPHTISTQKIRSVSHNNLVHHETRTNDYGYDLKKQVLAPEEIRKMLEKRMEERNRILTMKKADNYSPTEAVAKPWQTKDSFINQIYQESRH